MIDPVLDWATLLKGYDDHSASSQDGQALLATVIGDEQIEAAVDYYTSPTTTSAEALRMAFKLLQPTAATNRCLELLWSAAPNRQRTMAADLLQVTCRPSQLDEIEALLADDDPVRAEAALGVLFQLKHSIDLDTVQMCRIVRRCVQIADRHSLTVALQLAAGVLEEITDRTNASEDRQGRLTVNEIETLFASALGHDDRWVVEAALNYCGDLVPALNDHITTLALGDGSYTAPQARELLDREDG